MHANLCIIGTEVEPFSERKMCERKKQLVNYSIFSVAGRIQIQSVLLARGRPHSNSVRVIGTWQAAYKFSLFY
jgi:hypothetical protein